MKNNIFTLKVVSLCAGLLLTSCASFNEVDSRGRIFDTQNFLSNNSTQYLPSVRNVPPGGFTSAQANNWWQSLKDPLLDYLIYEAVNGSFDTHRAITNLEQAEAILRGARADLLPTIGLNTQVNAQESASSTLNNAINGQWNLDLFGRTRQEVQQARLNVEVNHATIKDVKRLILARTAQTYIAYRTLDARVQLSQSNLERLHSTKDKINRLVEGGYNSRLDLKRAETQIANLQSNLSNLKGQRTSVLNALALITRISPQHITNMLDEAPDSLNLPPQIAAPRLDYIVRHRPDIRAAEWALISATHGQRAAKLALYPDITLNGNIFSLSNLSDFPSFGNLSTAILTNIAQPLFGRGRLLAGVDLENARVRQALINYEETIYSAVLNIDSALMNWTTAQEQLEYDQVTLDTSVEAQELAQKLFFAGEESFTALIVAENARLSAQDNYLVSRQLALGSYINYSAATVPTW